LALLLTKRINYERYCIFLRSGAFDWGVYCASNPSFTTMNIFRRLVDRDVDSYYWFFVREVSFKIVEISIESTEGTYRDFSSYCETIRACLRQYYFTNCMHRKFYERSYRINLDRCDYISINNLVNYSLFNRINNIRIVYNGGDGYLNENAIKRVINILTNIARYSICE